MNTLIALASAVGGGLIGYFIFYRRFADRNLVTGLRKDNMELKQTLQETDRDRLEYEQQNIILKNEIQSLYTKNDDLTHVVSELSRYYYHMKKISDKMADLSRDLKQPLENIDREMKSFLYEEDDERNQEFVHHLEDNDESSENKDFF